MRSIAALACVMAVGCSGAQHPSPGHAIAARTVDVCVLIDRADPVPVEIVRESIARVSDEYRERTGIAFRIAAERPYDGDLLAYPIDQAFYLRRVCPDGAELRMVFSDRFVAKSETASFGESGDSSQLAGQSQPYFGFLIMYRVSDRYVSQDGAGNSALETALKHEIGHLFGLDHAVDERSFMHSPSNKSQGAWTDEVVRALRAHREKRWFPRA